MRDYIEKHLTLYWSPEQIAARWNKEHDDLQVSHVLIYRYIYSARGQKFYEYLYTQRYRPKKRRRIKPQREIIKNRTSIDERPEEINRRLNIGDFEGDLIVSRKGEKSALLTLIDRKSRFLLAEPLENKKPKLVEKKIRKIQKRQPLRSLTIDNGIEFKNHEKYGCTTYFCHPYSSWEKGQIEYANRLIRRFIPKKSRIADFSPQYIQKIVELINHTPRKCLDYRTPYEVHFNILPS